MLIQTLNSNPLKQLPVHGTTFFLAIISKSKQIISIRSHANFLPFMTVIKHCFQSDILRTVISASSLNFADLAKNYGALRFKDSM